MFGDDNFLNEGVYDDDIVDIKNKHITDTTGCIPYNYRKGILAGLKLIE
jgi:hypothetical protein